ncbi:MAG TPA: type II secretion system F family protein [Caulobacteraceae bacterium]|nr:type II secretion system F family protein [Caulobacteraceae bacterium]
MTVLVILLTWLLIGAAAVGADALAVASARRKLIDGRLQLLDATLGPLGPAGEATPAASRGQRLRDFTERLLGLGVSRRWGASLSRLTLVLSAPLAGAAAWLVLRSMAHAPAWLSAALAAVALVATPRALLGVEQRALKARFLDGFPDAIDMIVRTLRAGVPITAAVGTVAADAPQPVAAVFAHLADETRIGAPLDEALTRAAGWIGLPDFRFFAVAVGLQYATGGNLAATLEQLSVMIRRRRAMRLKVKAVSAEVRLSTWILSALPVLAVGALLVTSPDYLKPLIVDRRGNWILGAAGGALLAGLFVMRRLMRSVSAD